MENSGASTRNRDRFTLHIVSPTAKKITFTNLPCSTTIAELRTRIFEASPFHPPTESQRLIYRGRDILQPERTLADVFTQQAINASDCLTLHLATPPIPPYPQHQHSTVQHPLATNTHATPQPPQQSLHPTSPAVDMSTRQPQVGQSVPHTRFVAHTTPPQAHQLPALQQSFQQFQVIQAHITAQLAALHNQIVTNDHLANHQSHVPQHQLHLAPGPDMVPASVPASAHQQPASTPAFPSQKAHQQNQAPAPLRESDSHSPQSHASTSAESGSAANSGMAGVDSLAVNPGDGIPSSEQQRPAASAVYILSSPTGPQALLVSPSGLYTAPWSAGYPHAIASHHARVSLPMISGITGPPVPGFHMQPQATTFPHPHLSSAHQVQDPRFATPPSPVNSGVHQVQQQHQQHQQTQQSQQPQQQQQPQEHQQQARDIARVLVPLGRHLWLFVRLFGFVWFFTHGASWSRTILLCAIATVVFIGQSGMFRSVFQGLWDPIRRHADNLMPVAGHEQPGADGRQAPLSGAGGTAGGELSPEQVAQRLLEQRRAQGEHVIRQLFRRVERAIALFLASLAPGVAERHIQARDAAEAALQLRLREREERERNERVDSMNPPGGNSDTGDVPAAENSSSASDSAPVSTEPGDDSGPMPAQAIEI